MRAILLAHEPDGTGGLVERRFVERGVQVDTHIVTHDYDSPEDATPFPDLDDYDIVIAMGSVRSLTPEAPTYEWMEEEMALVRDVQASDTPFLGVCFGGQLLSRALGGKVEVAPETELGWCSIDDGDVPNPVGSGPWMEWHHDRFTAPPGATVLARNDQATQLIQIGRSVGTQFHPEVDPAHLEKFLENAPDEYLAEYATDRHELHRDAVANEQRNIVQCNAFVDWFLDEVAFPSASN